MKIHCEHVQPLRKVNGVWNFKYDSCHISKILLMGMTYPFCRLGWCGIFLSHKKVVKNDVRYNWCQRLLQFCATWQKYFMPYHSHVISMVWNGVKDKRRMDTNLFNVKTLASKNSSSCWIIRIYYYSYDLLTTF